MLPTGAGDVVAVPTGGDTAGGATGGEGGAAGGGAVVAAAGGAPGAVCANPGWATLEASKIEAARILMVFFLRRAQRALKTNQEVPGSFNHTLLCDRER